MTYKEKCPICGSEDYEIIDYDEECSDDCECLQWRYCSCPNNHKFYIERIYELVNIIIRPEGEEE